MKGIVLVIERPKVSDIVLVTNDVAKLYVFFRIPMWAGPDQRD